MTISFSRVASSNVPRTIRRRSTTKWAPVVEALNEIEIDEALEFQVEDQQEMTRVRNGVRAALNAQNSPIGIATRAIANPTEEQPEGMLLFIIKTADESEEATDEDDEEE